MLSFSVRTDGQTHMKDLVVAFGSFATAPKDNESCYVWTWLISIDFKFVLPFYILRELNEIPLGEDKWRAVCAG
jgi:hypothetical protein